MRERSIVPRFWFRGRRSFIARSGIQSRPRFGRIGKPIEAVQTVHIGSRRTEPARKPQLTLEPCCTASSCPNIGNDTRVLPQIGSRSAFFSNIVRLLLFKNSRFQQSLGRPAGVHTLTRLFGRSLLLLSMKTLFQRFYSGSG